MENKIKRIKDLMRKSDLYEVFEEIEKLFEGNDEYDEFILHEGRFNEIRREYNRGIVDFKESSKITNHIRKSLLDLLNEIGPKKKGGDVEVAFEGHQMETTINPVRLKTTTSYINDPDRAFTLSNLQKIQFYSDPARLFGTDKENRGWCVVEIFVENIGARVLDNWKLVLQIPKSIKCFEGFYENPTWFYENLLQGEQDSITIEADQNQHLIQKDSHSFKISVLPNFGIDEFKIEWEFLARDFSKTGFLNFKVVPQYKEVKNNIFIESSELPSTEVEISELIEEEPRTPFFLPSLFR